MSGARAAGCPAGSARVQYVGHPSTDFNQLQTASTSNTLSATFSSIPFFYLVLLRMEEGKGRMYTTGWTTRSLAISNPISSMTSKYARLGISLFFFFFLPLLSYRDIYISIARRVVVIATVRDDSWDEVVMSR